MELREIASQFDIGNIEKIKAHGEGHIHDTYLVTTDTGRYILQRINRNVFPDIETLMGNIVAVLVFLRKKLMESGEDVRRRTLTLHPLKNTNRYLLWDGDNPYRVYTFIEDSVCLQTVINPKEFEDCGYAFGHFQNLLSDFPVERLAEAIVGFHDTESRYDALERAIAEDKMGRVELVQEEIEFARAHRHWAAVLPTAHANGHLPLRVTHNDTKLNNILMDKQTLEPLCVIDLDTVMPGYSVCDFGDSVRFGASTASEDETDLSKVQLDLSLYEAYTKGFLRGCNGALGKEEAALLSAGAIVMTLECGVRFLTDYLCGDTYFKIRYPHHNLDRCHTQFKLVSEMEAHKAEMDAIITKHQ